jgi:hypothetical protein
VEWCRLLGGTTLHVAVLLLKLQLNNLVWQMLESTFDLRGAATPASSPQTLLDLLWAHAQSAYTTPV